MPPELEPTHKSNSLIKILGGVALAVVIVALGLYAYLRYFVDSTSNMPIVPTTQREENASLEFTQAHLMKNLSTTVSSTSAGPVKKEDFDFLKNFSVSTTTKNTTQKQQEDITVIRNSFSTLK